MARRYVTVRARLSDSELAELRSLAGTSDSDRLRKAIVRAARDDRMATQVARLVVDAVGAEVEARLASANDEISRHVGQRLAEGLRPVLASVQSELRRLRGGG